MDNNNLYPNSGDYFAPTEPERQVTEREQEIADTLKAIPLLNEVIAHFDEQIFFYGSVNSIPAEALIDPIACTHILAGNKLAHDNLVIERDFILGRVRNVKK